MLPNDDFTTIPAQYATNSPSGGPSGNSGAVVLISYRISKKLGWKVGNTVHEANIVSPVITDDTQTNGPTPVNEYLIGQRYTHGVHNIDWYKLYPRKEDNSGYYPYDQATATGRFSMGLHPGAVSLGCVTVDSAGASPYDSNQTWVSLRNHVDGGAFTYNGSSFVGFLYVVNS